MKRALPLLVLFLGQSLAAEVTVSEAVAFLDSLYRSESSRAELSMQIVTPDWERTLSMEVWTKGMDSTLIRITAPQREEGMGTLRIGDEMWNYLPNTNTVMRIPPSMMMASWMGSDFTNDDLVRETTFFDDYDVSWTEVEEAEEGRLYLEMIPHEDAPVVWGEVVVSLRGEDLLPVWMRYYDEDGELMRVMDYREYEETDGRVIPTVMELTPQDEEGSTTLVYEDVEFDLEVDEDVFTMRNLRSPG